MQEPTFADIDFSSLIFKVNRFLKFHLPLFHLR